MRVKYNLFTFQNETVSQDEMRLLSECSRSATWQRSLPLGLLAGIVTRAAVDMGKLTPHPRSAFITYTQFT